MSPFLILLIAVSITGIVIGELAERVITRFILKIIYYLKVSNYKFKKCNHLWTSVGEYSLAFTKYRDVIYCPSCDKTLDVNRGLAQSIVKKSEVKKQYTDTIMKNIEKELLKAKTDLENFKEYNELIIENSHNSELEKSLKGYDK